MKAITYDNLVAQLIETVPEFPVDPEYVQDNLTYIVFNDLTRFVNSQFETNNNDEILQRIFNFIEGAARSQDRKIIDVLWDSFNELAIKEPDKAKSYMGVYTRRIFQDVEDEIYGRPSVARKIRRIIKQLWWKP